MKSVSGKGSACCNVLGKGSTNCIALARCVYKALDASEGVNRTKLNLKQNSNCLCIPREASLGASS